MHTYTTATCLLCAFNMYVFSKETLVTKSRSNGTIPVFIYTYCYDFTNHMKLLRSLYYSHAHEFICVSTYLDG